MYFNGTGIWGGEIVLKNPETEINQSLNQLNSDVGPLPAWYPFGNI